MKFNRRSHRLSEHDYTQPGFYFVTICTYKNLLLFGEISNERVVLNGTGRIVEAHWRSIPGHYAHIRLDEFIVMGNHLHGIIEIAGRAPEGQCAPYPSIESFGKPVCGSIPTIIRSFKAGVTREMRAAQGRECVVWQRGFYDVIMRVDPDLERTRQYIRNNAIKHARGEND
jgi:REP element-mobilizing transposase RayT